jgi:hypothetical protein
MKMQAIFIKNLKATLMALFFLFFTNLVHAVCPVSGDTTTATGYSPDMCGSSTTPAGTPINKTCCVSANTSNNVYTIYNGGTAQSVIINSTCTQDVAIPGLEALEWTKFSTAPVAGGKLTCITITAIPNGVWLGFVDNKWSTAANWAGNVVPDSTVVATFDNRCRANCTGVVMDINVNVKGVSVASTSTMTSLTANTGVTVTVGSSGWTQAKTGFTFDGTLAASMTWSGTTSISAGTFQPSTAGTNTFLDLAITGGTFNAGTSAVAFGAANITTGTYTQTSGSSNFGGAITLSSAGTITTGTSTTTIAGLLTVVTGTSYTSSGTDNINGGVNMTGGTITTGTLTENSSVTMSGGTWNLSSGTSIFNNNGNNLGVTISGGTMLPAANATVQFKGTSINAGTGALMLTGGTFGAATPVTGTTVTLSGQFLLSSATSKYYSAGTDNFNNYVTVSAAGTVTTGTLTTKGVLTISAGTWNLNNTTLFNNDNLANSFIMSGGTILPAAGVSVSFKGTTTSLNMTGGTYGTATTSGTLSFAAAVSLIPTAASIWVHTGTAAVTITGGLTMKDDSASSNTCKFGDAASTGAISIGAIALQYTGGTATSTPLFTQGNSALTAASFTLNSTVTSASGGAKFTGGTGNVTISGNYIFDCGTNNESNTFTGPTGNLEIDGGTITITTVAGANDCSNQFTLTNTNLILNGGTQTFGGTNSPGGSGSNVSSLSMKSLTVGFNATAKTKTIGSGLTLTGTGNAFVINGSQATDAYTSSRPIAITNGDMAINVTTGTLTTTLSSTTTTSGINLTSSTTGGNVTFNPTGTGAMVLNSSGALINFTNSFTSTDTGAHITGTQNFVMNGTIANTTINMAGGSFGTSGTFTISKTASTSIVGLNTLANAFTKPIVITSGILQLNPSTGTCSGATVCNLTAATVTLNYGGSLVCGNGTYTITTLNFNGGFLDCGSYNLNWTGATGDGKWSTPGNWGTGGTHTVPSGTQVAIFSTNYCTGTNCLVNIDTAQTVGGISLLSSYNCGADCTITQNASLTINSGGYYQDAGTFVGSTNTANFFKNAGVFDVNGGSFSSTYGTTTFNASTAQTLDFTGFSGTFFGPVAINGSGATYTLISTMPVLANDFTFGDTGTGTLTGGIINTTGNVTVNNKGYTGTTVLTLSGTSSVNFNATGGTAYNLPNVTISNSAGTITFTSGATYLINNDFIHSGNSTLTLTGTTMQFDSALSTTQAITLKSSEIFNNVSFTSSNQVTETFTGTMNVTGVLTVNTSGGTCTFSGTGGINFTGFGNATADISFAGSGCTGSTAITVATTGGNVIVKNTAGVSMPAFIVTASGGGAGYTVTYASGSTMNFTNTYTYSGAATLVASATVNFNNTQTITAGSAVGTVYNNVNITPTSSRTLTIQDTLNVQGTLSLGAAAGSTCTLKKGTGAGIINMTGLQVNVANAGCVGSTTNATAVLQMAGPYTGTNQTITSSTSGAALPDFAVTSVSPNTITFGGTNINYDFDGGYNFSGTASVVAGTSLIEFSSTAAETITPGANAVYGKVQFTQGSTNAYTISGTLNMTGTLEFQTLSGLNSCTLNTGTINTTGSTVTFTQPTAGSLNLTVSGTAANVTLNNTAAQDKFTGTLTVDKLGKSATFTAANTFGTAMPISILNGTLAFSGAVSTTGTLTVQSTGAVSGTAALTNSFGNMILNNTVTATYTKNLGILAITAGSGACPTNANVAAGSVCGGIVAP